MINYHELVLKEFKLMTPKKKKAFILENKELLKKFHNVEGYSHRWNLWNECLCWLEKYCKNLDYKLNPVFSIKDNFSVENREKNEKVLKQWDAIRIELYKKEQNGK